MVRGIQAWPIARIFILNRAGQPWENVGRSVSSLEEHNVTPPSHPIGVQGLKKAFGRSAGGSHGRSSQPLPCLIN